MNFITKGAKQMRDLPANLLNYTEAGADSWEPNEFVDLNGIFERVKQKRKLLIEESGPSLRAVTRPPSTAMMRVFLSSFSRI